MESNLTSTTLDSQEQILTVNPEYEALLPKLSQEEYEALKTSIKNEGLHFPITINKDRVILDGHNRFKICQELQIAIKFEVKEFTNPLLEKKFVIEANLRRRHLTKFQRAEMGMPLLEIEKELAKQRQLKGLPSNGGKVDKNGYAPFRN